jgi:hypothetical protein
MKVENSMGMRQLRKIILIINVGFADLLGHGLL